MKKAVAVFILCLSSINAGASKTKPLSKIGDVVAPVVQNKSAIPDAPAGQIVFDLDVANSGAGAGFWALGSSGTWLELASAASGGINPLARFHSTTSTSIPDNTYTVINFDTSDWDNTTSVTTGSGWRFTAPQAGKYCVNSKFTLSSATYSGNFGFQLWLYKNSSQYSELGNFLMPSGSISFQVRANGSDCVSMAINDFIDVRVYQNSGATQATDGSTAGNYIDVTRVGN